MLGTIGRGLRVNGCKNAMERLLDTRGLARFDAFDLAIEALAELVPGTSMRLAFDHEPLALYAFLEKNDYCYRISCRADQHYEITISECS